MAVNNDGSPIADITPIAGSMGPDEFHTAYNLPCTPHGPVQSVCAAPATFGPQEIALVEDGSYQPNPGETLEGDLAGFDSYYGLPACTVANGCLSVVNEQGQASPLPPPYSDWQDEIALDVETAHEICQTCKILLVEATGGSLADLSQANAAAASFHPVSVSNSWNSYDFGTASYIGDYYSPGVAFVSATGDIEKDSGAWPADIPSVIGASGTMLQLNTDDTWAGETVWSRPDLQPSYDVGTGGGCSTANSAPVWQTSLPNWSSVGCGTYKAFGDLSADADPRTGASIYMNGSFDRFGGTSLSTPLIASMIALADNNQNYDEVSEVPYASFNSTNSHDITSGTNCLNGLTLNCISGVGFDEPSGLGSPNGLSGFILPTPTSLATTADTAGAYYNGTQVDLTWTAPSTNTPVAGYYVIRNGTQIADVTSGTSYTDSSVTANSNYAYQVEAHYAGNNVSAPNDLSLRTYLPADVNQDNSVNLLDLSLLANKFGACNSSLGLADINHDGCVNLLDLSLLANKYSG